MKLNRIAIFAIFAVGYMFAAIPQDDTPCIGPSESVRITAQQINKNEPAYAFLITNLLESPIHAIYLGMGKNYELKGYSLNVPIKIESPVGWKGLHIFGYENPYMHYEWKSEAASNDIQPQKSASGFRIDLPASKLTKKLYFGDGTEVIQTNFENMGFHVYSRDNQCYWGVIKTVDFMK